MSRPGVYPPVIQSAQPSGLPGKLRTQWHTARHCAANFNVRIHGLGDRDLLRGQALARGAFFASQRCHVEIALTWVVQNAVFNPVERIALFKNCVANEGKCILGRSQGG